MPTSDNLKKYTETISKTVAALGQTTDSIDSKIKELVTVLTAVNSGLLSSETKVKAALNNIGKGKFESKSVLASYLKTLQIVDKDAESIVSKWEELKNLSIDELKRTTEYTLIQTELNNSLDELFDTKQDITKESQEQLDLQEKQLDLVGDIAKKYKQFQSAVSNNGISLKDINIDLTKGANIINEFLDNSDAVIPNLFDPSAFNFDDLKKYSADLASLKKAWSTGQLDVQLPSGTSTIDIDSANSQLNGLIDTIKPQIDEEFKLRDQNLKKYIALQNGYNLDEHTNVLKYIDTEQDVESDKVSAINSLLEDQVNLIKDYAGRIQNVSQLSSEDLKTLQSKINLLNSEDRKSVV